MSKRNKTSKSKTMTTQDATRPFVPGPYNGAKNHKAGCTHRGATPFLQLGGCTLLAASAQEVGEDANVSPYAALISVGGQTLMNLALREASVAYAPVVATNPDGAILFPGLATLKPARPPVPVPKATLVIDWPDGGAPPVGLDFWQALLADLFKVQGNVGLFCMGGHGRTGTALAILAHLSGVVPEGADVVDWVRDNYCDEAVETTAQLDYLNKVVGIKTMAQGSRSYGGMGQGYGFGSGTAQQWSKGAPIGKTAAKGDGLDGECAFCTKPAEWDVAGQDYLCGTHKGMTGHHNWSI